jgi:hypothetical protein
VRSIGCKVQVQEIAGSESKDTTQQQRIDEFGSDGKPPAGELMKLLCEDHNGTYALAGQTERGTAAPLAIELKSMLLAGEDNKDGASSLTTRRTSRNGDFGMLKLPLRAANDWRPVAIPVQWSQLRAHADIDQH